MLHKPPYKKLAENLAKKVAKLERKIESLESDLDMMFEDDTDSEELIELLRENERLNEIVSFFNLNEEGLFAWSEVRYIPSSKADEIKARIEGMLV